MTVGPILVLGGSRSARADLVADLVARAPGTALVLDGSSRLLERHLDVGPDGSVEVRELDPVALLESFAAGASEEVDDPVIDALSVGTDGALAAVLRWEYARRAVHAGAWDRVVVELDGTTSALRRIAAPAELSEYLERRWPVNQRYAAMAAGDRAGAATRRAHEIAETVAAVVAMLSGPVEIHVAGENETESFRLRAVAEVARGARGIEVSRRVGGDGGGVGYLARLALPADPGTPSCSREVLRVTAEGVHLVVPLPAVLRRCVPGDWWSGEDGLTVEFVPDPAQWPPRLHTGIGEPAAG